MARSLDELFLSLAVWLKLLKKLDLIFDYYLGVYISDWTSLYLQFTCNA